MSGPPATPDGRDLVVRGRLWRRSNPGLSGDQRQALVDKLMAARRALRAALTANDPDALERGRVWWDDDAPDLNCHMDRNAPYAPWWSRLSKA